MTSLKKYIDNHNQEIEETQEQILEIQKQLRDLEQQLRVKQQLHQAQKTAEVEVSKSLSHRRSLISVGKAKEIWGENSDYFFVIGSDIVKQIRQWYRIHELLAQVSLLIVPRPGYTINESDLKALEDIGGKCQIADLNAPAVSSTAYRKDGNENVLIQPVQDYIHQEKLYA